MHYLIKPQWATSKGSNMLPIVIRLSKTGKMPCASYSIPAESCITGSRLHAVDGSVCQSCYARKNFYRMPTVREPRDWNLEVWNQVVKSGEVELWIDAMVKAIGPKAKFFRWFDSGDLQSVQMLRAIMAVAVELPDCQFWLPTHETGILRAFKGKIPSNLTIRKSADMIGWIDDTGIAGVLSSTVGLKANPSGSEQCKAYTQGGKCLDCRACWDHSILNINYPLH